MLVCAAYNLPGSSVLGAKSEQNIRTAIFPGSQAVSRERRWLSLLGKGAGLP